MNFANHFTASFNRLTCLSLTLLMLLFAAPPLTAQPQQSWVAQWNGPDSDEDQVRDIVVKDGCVYITGWTTQDYRRAFATVKYDYDGQELWSHTYQGFLGPNQPDEAEALAVDGAGNVYVTGWSAERTDEFSDYIDVVLLKYDPAGNLLWAQRYRSPGRNNQPSDIALDSQGHIYIAGASWIDGGFDLLLLKYDPDGNLLWDRSIGESGDKWDAGYAIAVDPSDNAIVVGYTEPYVSLDSAAYLVKYDPAGNLVWERIRDGFSNVDAAERVVTDDAGYVYVLGEVGEIYDTLRIWTARYDPAGTMLWEDDYTGTAEAADYAGGIALDPEGNVVVCGQSWDEPNTISIVTIKYSPGGAILWQHLEQADYANASGRDLAVDRLGNVYVTGYGYNANGYEDFITLRYSPAGELAWTEIYADPNGRSDLPRAITVDRALNVFTIGRAWVGFDNYYDYTTVRYRQSFVGDLNCDGEISFDDINPFVRALGGSAGYEQAYPYCDYDHADCNQDGTVDFDDINAFVALLSGD